MVQVQGGHPSNYLRSQTFRNFIDRRLKQGDIDLGYRRPKYPVSVRALQMKCNRVQGNTDDFARDVARVDSAIL